MSKIEGFRLDSLEVHFGRTIKTGEYENCRADLTIGGVITAQQDMGKVSSQLFQLLDEQISDQLDRATNGTQNPNAETKPEPGKNKQSGKKKEKDSETTPSDNGKKFATEKQLKKIFAMGYEKGLEKNEIVQQLKERFGTSDIVDKVSRGEVSDFIQELQPEELPF